VNTEVDPKPLWDREIENETTTVVLTQQTGRIGRSSMRLESSPVERKLDRPDERESRRIGKTLDPAGCQRP
jgi:hypothetical protein